MKIFNLQTATKTLIFLKENIIDAYDKLCQKSSTVSWQLHNISNRLNEIQIRQKNKVYKQKYIELGTAKSNAEHRLSITKNALENTVIRIQNRNNNHNIQPDEISKNQTL